MSNRPNECLDRALHWGRAALPALATLLSLTISACLPVSSRHPVTVPADTLRPAAATGRWAASPFPLGAAFTSMRLDFSSQPATLWARTDSFDISEWEVRLVHLGQHWFAELRLTALVDEGEAVARAELDTMPYPYMISRLEVSSDTLTLRPLWDSQLAKFDRVNPGWFDLQCHGISVEVCDLESSTAKLRRFLGEYGHVDSLYGVASSFVREP